MDPLKPVEKASKKVFQLSLWQLLGILFIIVPFAVVITVPLSMRFWSWAKSKWTAAPPVTPAPPA